MASVPSIEAKHIQAAIDDVRRDGVPAGRGSTRFCLVIGGQHYPPKYIVAMAARHAVGRELRPNEFSGGVQTNAIFERIGLAVRSCNCGGIDTGPAAKGRRPTTPPHARMSGEVTVARVAVRGRTSESPQVAERILRDVFGSLWPKGLRAKFTVTPGGFVHSTWPRSWSGRSGWKSRRADIEPLFQEAERQLARVVTDKVYRAAAGKTDVLTIGIDLNGDDVAELAELVAVYDVARRSVIRWTGKSYPTPGQEHHLVHVVDLGSHLLETAGERVLILGCHDLNLFSPRARKNQSPGGLRRARCEEMDRKVARFKPTVVLHHPHDTDTPNIWRMPWLSLERAMPSVRVWASGIGYRNPFAPKPRAKLDKVLDQMKSAPEDVQDIVVNAHTYE